jgi:hypothetical protein
MVFEGIVEGYASWGKVGYICMNRFRKAVRYKLKRTAGMTASFITLAMGVLGSFFVRGWWND